MVSQKEVENFYWSQDKSWGTVKEGRDVDIYLKKDTILFGYIIFPLKPCKYMVCQVSSCKMSHTIISSLLGKSLSHKRNESEMIMVCYFKHLFRFITVKSYWVRGWKDKWDLGLKAILQLGRKTGLSPQNTSMWASITQGQRQCIRG